MTTLPGELQSVSMEPGANQTEGSVDVFWPSPQQSRIWAGGADHSNSVILLAAEGGIEEERLRGALEKLAERHEILRTVCRLRAGMKVPFQAVLDALQPSLDRRTQAFDEAFDQEIRRKFDLEEGPVFSASLVRSPHNRDDAALFLTLPAMLSDGYSLDLLARELDTIYVGGESEAAALSYAQYGQWQSDLLEATDDDAQLAKKFWRENSSPALNWPSSGSFQPEVVTISSAFGDVAAPVSGDVFLAAWQCLLWRLTGQEQFETRVWFSGREMEELRNVPGPIEKYLPVPARFGGSPEFSEVVAFVRSGQEKAAEWQEYFTPEGGDAPVLFEFRDWPQLAHFRVVRQASLSDSFSLKLVAFRDELEFHFDASRFPREMVERWASHYSILLQAAIANPRTSVARLPLLTEAETRQILVDWNLTVAAYPRERCLHELFEEQVERTPDAPAIVTEAGVLSYGEVNRRANRLAWHLRGLGVGPDSLVGLSLDRNADLIVAVLGILKAGGAYVPVSADHPKARLAHQLSGAAAVITDSKLLPMMPELTCPKVLMDGSDWVSQNAENPAGSATPENLVYVIYTSGSTGVPKGVAVRHRNLVNYAWFIASRLGGEHLHFATVSPLTADLGNTSVYPSLISGGCLHVIPAEVAGDSVRLTEWQKRQPYDVLKIVPSHLSALLESEAGRGVLPRRHLITGGEQLISRLVERIRALDAGCEIWNHYGPTETTVGSLMLQVSREREFGTAIPIGRPIANTQVYIVDALGQTAPIGVVGELCIAGDGVTAGYLNQPEMTAQRFIDGRYHTGDLARFGTDGAVEFLGRSDHQVKIRGYRVELGEIEAAISRYPGARQAIVIARADERGDAQLVAYVAAATGFDVDALRASLKQELPAYMVPAAIVTMPKLPLTANGKIDRLNLPAPEQVKPRTVTAPRTETERQVAAMWCEVFRRDVIGVEENFFDLGGHSLLATQVISRVRERFSVHLDMTVLFQQPTIEALCVAIDNAEAEAADFVIVPVARTSYRANKNI